jgi:hypothetical protein
VEKLVDCGNRIGGPSKAKLRRFEQSKDCSLVIVGIQKTCAGGFLKAKLKWQDFALQVTFVLSTDLDYGTVTNYRTRGPIGAGNRYLLSGSARAA